MYDYVIIGVILTGWFLAEVGRQSWVVYGLLRTNDAVMPALATRDMKAAKTRLLVFQARKTR